MGKGQKPGMRIKFLSGLSENVPEKETEARWQKPLHPTPPHPEKELQGNWGSEALFEGTKSEPGLAGAGCGPTQPWPQRQRLGSRSPAPRRPPNLQPHRERGLQSGACQVSARPKAHQPRRRLLRLFKNTLSRRVRLLPRPFPGPNFFNCSKNSTWGLSLDLPTPWPLPASPARGSGGGQAGVPARGADSPWWVGGYLCTVALTEFP